jgi:hypothetical protein
LPSICRAASLSAFAASIWHKSYSVTIEVDVAKILGIVRLLALAVLCAFGPSGQHVSGASTIDELWRFLTPDTVERH